VIKQQRQKLLKHNDQNKKSCERVSLSEPKGDSVLRNRNLTTKTKDIPDCKIKFLSEYSVDVYHDCNTVSAQNR